MKKVLLSSCLALCLMSNGLQAQDEVYDANKIADIFYQLNGDPKDPKRKVNHAVGFCASGVFEPSKKISSSVDVPLFKQANIPVEVRYSLGGAFMSDKSKTRGMALRLQGSDEVWTMVMLATEINFARTPEEFGKFFEMRLPVNGKVDQAKIAKMTQEVDSYRKFDQYTSKVGITPSVANTAFYSIHSFMFKDAKTGKMIPLRWKFVPQDGVKYLSENELKKIGDQFLVENFKKYIQNKPVVYKMYLIYPNSGDKTDDTTALWEGKHKEVFVGTLKVSNYDGNGCNPDVYFPSDLPKGVGAPQDPLFDVRNEAYAITFGRRQ